MCLKKIVTLYHWICNLSPYVLVQILSESWNAIFNHLEYQK
jgi:hypothetical protein